MKRLFALLLLAAVLMVSAAASASFDLTAMTESELHTLANDIVVELGNRQGSAVTRLGAYTVEIKGAELMKDDDGGDCLVITVEWSHQTAEPQTFFWSFNYYAFQDGIEIGSPDAYISLPIDTEDTRIKAGAVLETQIAFSLRNTRSPVEIEISEYLGESSAKAEKIFDLTALDGGATAGQTINSGSTGGVTEGGNTGSGTEGSNTGGLSVIGKPRR